MPALVACFFRYYNWTHIWDEQVIRRAIAVGVKNRTFGYVANARRDAQENLVLSGPAATVVHFGEDVPTHELDMGEGAFLLSAAYAQQLLTPPAPPRTEIDATNGTGTQTGEQQMGVYGGEMGGRAVVNDQPFATVPTPSTSKPVAPGRGGRGYRLRLKVKPGDFFYVMKAVERLNERAASMETTVNVVATAKPDQPFVANTLHNLVVEPMVEESDVVVLEEQVED